jgi:hypothetical protein
MEWRSKDQGATHVVVVVETTVFSGEATDFGQKLQRNEPQRK